MTKKNTEKIALLKERIDDYFCECDSQNEDEINKPYTLSGLLCKLEITRQEFERLMTKKAYTALFNRVLAKIEAFTEEYALTGDLSVRAAANSLKYNFGWNERKCTTDKEAPAKSIRIILDGDLAQLAE